MYKRLELRHQPLAEATPPGVEKHERVLPGSPEDEVVERRPGEISVIKAVAGRRQHRRRERDAEKKRRKTGNPQRPHVNDSLGRSASPSLLCSFRKLAMCVWGGGGGGSNKNPNKKREKGRSTLIPTPPYTSAVVVNGDVAAVPKVSGGCAYSSRRYALRWSFRLA